MENLLNSGIQVIIWLQSLGSWLTPIMSLFTFLGSEQFYLIIAPALLWCIDSKLGLRMGLFLMINGMVITALKVTFHGPRPYWYTNNVNVHRVENSFGAPSGHAQNGVVVWGTLAKGINNRWAWVIAVVLMFLIGISRIYLAVHFPHDVLLGWLFGGVMLWVFLHFERPVVDWIRKYQPGIQLLMIFLFSLFLILIVVLAQLSLRGWSLPPEWVNNAHQAFPDEPVLNPLSFHNYLSSTGAFFGLAAGWIWITHQGGFSTKGDWWKLVLRYVLGLAGVLILSRGLGSLFIDTESFISYSIRYIRYALLGFWISGFAPWLFVKLKIATQASSPSL